MSVEITNLTNGMRVVTDPMPRLRSATVGVWVNAGARNETAKMQGVSHLLEHMAFKGTKRRDAKRIAEEIEAVGGHLNAYTGREQTVYYARVLKDDLPLAVDIIADILQHSVFDKTELAREQHVVVQEIGQSEDTPDDIIFDHLFNVAYPGQPLGRAILGTVETVRGFTPGALKTYMRDWYAGANMTLIAAGGVDHGELVRLAGKSFDDVGAKPKGKAAAARYRGGDYRKKDKLEQAHLTLAIEGVSLHDPDIFTAQVFTGVLGGGMSSRLFQEVREKRGLCYSVYAFGNYFHDSGIIGVYAGTGGKELRELVPVVVGEIEALAKNATEEEVARARAQLKASLLMSRESPSARAEQVAADLAAFGRVLSVNELLRRLEAVDAAAVRRFAARLMRRAAPSVAALGPVGALESYDRLAARFG